jgi:hypothetical protein
MLEPPIIKASALAVAARPRAPTRTRRVCGSKCSTRRQHDGTHD